MMQMQPSPFEWVVRALAEIKWPALVVGSYFLGRKIQQIESRLAKAESHLDNIVTKHMPALYRALGEIRSLIMYKGR
jgi:hypothetical protein